MPEKINFTHLKLEFGTFVHIYNDNQPTNTMAPRTTGAIALNSVGNSKGDYYFLNLETGRRVSRHQWTVLPMPHSVIQQVHLLALKDKMPLLRQQSLVFERRPGISLDHVDLEDEAVDLLAFGDEGDDDDYDPGNPLPDVPLVHDNVVSLNELHDLHLDGGSVVSSHSSEDDLSVHSSHSLGSESSDESTYSNMSNSDVEDEESTVTSVIAAPVREPSPDPQPGPASTEQIVRDDAPSHEPSSAPLILHATLDDSE